MPECYTHVHTATQALMRSGHTVASTSAFIAGANGPDPLFLYQWWSKKPRPDLPGLAQRMQHEKTGDFLMSLIRYAATPIQQSYALGFVAHYTTNCTLYPYLAAMSGKGTPYDDTYGQYILAAALDSDLYWQNYHSRTVPLHAGTPVLITDELAQVTALLRDAIRETYEEDVPLLALSDAYHHNLTVRRMMISRTGMNKRLLQLLEPTSHYKYSGPLYCRTQPAKPLRRLPADWKNPYNGDVVHLTTGEVLSVAAQTGAICITAAMRYWLGTLEETTMDEMLGNNDYYTGIPCAKPQAAPQRAEREEKPAPAPMAEPLAAPGDARAI